MKLPFLAGNWKMNKSRKEALEFAEELKRLYSGTDVRAAICAPFVHLEPLKRAFEGTKIKVGAQNVHFEKSGAYTGEISIPMLEEIGVDLCIVGHSERRQYFGETDETVNKKIRALTQTSIIPILCVGESLSQREEGKERNVVEMQVKLALEGISTDQVSSMVLAYEPIWAIGTGKTATALQAEEMCRHIRDTVADLYDEETACNLTIQYGGSMKPTNVTELMNMENIDGGLVGGASLSAKDFMEMIDF